MAEGSKVGAVQAHLSEYVSRYVVLASIVLVPLAGIAGDVAAEVGPDTRLGHTLLSVGSALSTGAAIAVWLRNRGAFEAAPLTAQAAITTAAAAAGVAAVQGGAPIGLEDPETDAMHATANLPSDEVEFAAPPPPAPDETNTPVQPSQAGLTDAEADDPPRA